MRKMLFLLTAKREKSRLVVSILAIALIVAVLSLSFNVLASIYEYSNRYRNSVEEKVFILEKPRELKRYNWEVGFSEPLFSMKSINQLKRSSKVLGVIPIYHDTFLNRYWTHLVVEHPNILKAHPNIKFYMVTSDYFEFFKIPLTKGIPKPGSVVLNKGLFEELFKDEAFLNQQIRFGREQFEISDVVEDDHRGLNVRIQPQEILVAYFIVQPNNLKAEKLLIKLEEVTGGLQALQDEIVNNYDVAGLIFEPFLNDRDQLVFEYQEAATVLVLFSLILCIVAEAGIFGIFYLINEKKKKDYCVRMILGNSRRDLFLDVIFEFLMMSLMGSLIGSLIAFGIISSINTVSRPPIPIVNHLSVNGFVLMNMLLLSVLLGIFPTYKLTTYQPLELLSDRKRGV